MTTTSRSRWGRACERLAQRLAAEVELDRLFGQRLVAGDEVPEHGVVALPDWSVEARRCPCRGSHLEHLLDGEGRLIRDLVERRLAAELRPEKAIGTVDLLQALDDVDGHPDRPRLVRERPRDRLADPPRRVGGELEPAAPVELLDRADQPERSLLDEVEEGETLVPVVLRDRDDEAEVGLDHPLLRLHVPALDALRELHLLRSREQLVAAGLAEEELECVRRGLDGRRDRGDDLGLGRRKLDDLDSALVELAEQCLLLELGQLERLGDLREIGRSDRPDLLGLLEQ